MDSTDRTVFNQNEIDDGNNNEEVEVEEIDEFFDEEDYDYENEDQEIELVRRLIILNVPYVINSNGLRCHIGFSESLHNGSEPGFKFYCGATVGQNDYHAPCLECDGRCGPTNGCQCTSCYALEAFFKRESERNKIYNKDGAPTSISFDHYHTNKFRHYCGRFVGQHGYSSTTRNNCCDGRCGPTNGCQCQACYEIDNHIQDSNVTQNIPLLMNQIKDLNSLEECDIMEHQLESLNKTLQNKKMVLKKLKEEKEKNPDNLCAVCFESPKSIAFIPCGHVFLCNKCSQDSRFLKETNCPICREPFTSLLKLYL